MLYSDKALRTEEFRDLRDFSDLAVSFVRDIRDGFICKAEGDGMRSTSIYLLPRQKNPPGKKAKKRS